MRKIVLMIILFMCLFLNNYAMPSIKGLDAHIDSLKNSLKQSNPYDEKMSSASHDISMFDPEEIKKNLNWDDYSDVFRAVGHLVPEGYGESKYDYGVTDVRTFQDKSLEDLRAERQKGERDFITRNVLIGFGVLILIFGLGYSAQSKKET